MQSQRKTELPKAKKVRCCVALVIVWLAWPCGSELVRADEASTDRQRQYEFYALTHGGDPGLGRAVFRDKVRTRCAVCHSVKGEAGLVGPDLSRIGGKFDRPHLIESLLQPSRQIVEGYRTTVVRTHGGRVLAGIVKERLAGHLTLVDVNAIPQSVAFADIADRMETQVSLMPDGLIEAISMEEFAGLIAYLETLRAGGKPTPGEGVTGRIGLPAGFEIRTVATGLTGCTALETLPDGRVLVCEQTGAVRVVKNGQLVDEPFVTLNVDCHWERGVIGVTIDPNFSSTPYVYVCYIAKEPYPHHRVSRFRAEGNVAVGSEQVLLAGDDQRTLGGQVPAGHQGGALHFGLDGKLYVAIGEQTAETPAQDLGSLQGKLLRIDSDGTIPGDNPFFDRTSGKYRSIWALGLRNPFTVAFHRATGEPWINDVGGKFEEINRGRAGANYGWPVVDQGPTNDRRFQSPVHYYPQASISGGAFSAPESTWPPEYRERYFFADFVHGWIKLLDPDQPERAETFVTGLNRPVDIRFAPDDSLYILLRNAWVIDDKFQPRTGSLLRIQYTGKR
jgi:putative heme-binding domain-containing protein